ncbi:MAG: hypothetical protein QOJ82_3870, partial [Solirubrobacteraceae bacterium]|nr:hypothetical protein [Solirubrobacteraceae bacterium]
MSRRCLVGVLGLLTMLAMAP